MKFKLLIPVLITLILLTGCQSATTTPTTNPKQPLVAPTSIPSAVEIPINEPLVAPTSIPSAVEIPTNEPLVAHTSIPSAVEMPTNSTTILLYSVNLKGPLTSIPYL